MYLFWRFYTPRNLSEYLPGPSQGKQNCTNINKTPFFLKRNGWNCNFSEVKRFFSNGGCCHTHPYLLFISWNGKHVRTNNYSPTADNITTWYSWGNTTKHRNWMICFTFHLKTCILENSGSILPVSFFVCFKN